MEKHRFEVWLEKSVIVIVLFGVFGSVQADGVRMTNVWRAPLITNKLAQSLYSAPLVTLNRNATYLLFGLSQCTKLQYEQKSSTGATMWLINVCNSALTVLFTSDSGQVWGTTDVFANGRTALWINGMFDPRTVGTIHLFACPKGTTAVKPNGSSIWETTYSGEYTCK